MQNREILGVNTSLGAFPRQGKPVGSGALHREGSRCLTPGACYCCADEEVRNGWIGGQVGRKVHGKGIEVGVEGEWWEVCGPHCGFGQPKSWWRKGNMCHDRDGGEEGMMLG